GGDRQAGRVIAIRARRAEPRDTEAIARIYCGAADRRTATSEALARYGDRRAAHRRSSTLDVRLRGQMRAEVLLEQGDRVVEIERSIDAHPAQAELVARRRDPFVQERIARGDVASRALGIGREAV